MTSPADIVVVDRFASLRAELLTLLTGLSEDDWMRPTVAPRWSVKDVAAHLLGGDIGTLSRARDGFLRSGAIAGAYSELVDLVDRLNEEWIVASRRMSPRLILESLAFTGPQVETYFSSLDLTAVGGPVSWAGPDPAPVWFDVAREFTERWHHQQQIRDATRRPSLYHPYFFSPVLDTFVRALAYNYRDVAAPEGTVIRFEISGDAGNTWYLAKRGRNWALTLDCETDPATDVILPQDIAWRVFTKGVDSETARTAALVRGDMALASRIFRTVCVIG
jgi:uncharacterized protein (TIGR03083 family)